MDTRDHAISHVWIHFIPTSLCLRREEKHFIWAGIETRSFCLTNRPWPLELINPFLKYGQPRPLFLSQSIYKQWQHTLTIELCNTSPLQCSVHLVSSCSWRESLICTAAKLTRCLLLSLVNWNGGAHSIEVAFALLTQLPQVRSRVCSNPFSSACVRDFVNVVGSVVLKLVLLKKLPGKGAHLQNLDKLERNTTSMTWAI